MKVVLLRHATRSAHSLGDSPLNAVGQSQAEELARLATPQGRLPYPTRLFSSPKRRAKETLAPLANLNQLTVEIDARLDERHQNETQREFEARIKDLLAEISTQATSAPSKVSSEGREPCLFLCSHLDWLEAALIFIPSDLSDLEISMPWAAASFRIFKIQDGLWVHQGSGNAP